jgi:tRNA(fMet)-specific endonuclease VapC
MIILDTDLLSLLQQASGEPFQTLQDRLEEASKTRLVCVTIISFEEQLRGWLDWIVKAKTLDEQVFRYKKLRAFHEDFSTRIMLDFDRAAANQFAELKKKRVRVGTMDLKIASIALAKNATLLSRNLQDFQKIPGLKVEDWTKPQ